MAVPNRPRGRPQSAIQTLGLGITRRSRRPPPPAVMTHASLSEVRVTPRSYRVFRETSRVPEIDGGDRFLALGNHALAVEVDVVRGRIHAALDRVFRSDGGFTNPIQAAHPPGRGGARAAPSPGPAE